MGQNLNEKSESVWFKLRWRGKIPKNERGKSTVTRTVTSNQQKVGIVENYFDIFLTLRNLHPEIGVNL